MIGTCSTGFEQRPDILPLAHVRASSSCALAPSPSNHTATPSPPPPPFTAPHSGRTIRWSRSTSGSLVYNAGVPQCLPTTHRISSSSHRPWDLRAPPHPEPGARLDLGAPALILFEEVMGWKLKLLYGSRYKAIDLQK